MRKLIVLERPESWSLNVPGVETVAAENYLLGQEFHSSSRTRVFNLCRSYRYQTVGYYVSLLASARGHRPVPSVHTMQELRVPAVVRIATEELEPEIARALRELKTDRFFLSIYFGRNLAKCYDRVSRLLFEQFPVPFLRADFRKRDGWKLDRLRAIAVEDIPATHRTFVEEQAQRHFARPPARRRNTHRFDLAILSDTSEADSPSNAKALERFERAAKKVGLTPYFIGHEQLSRIAEYDALFIRETTAVNHPSFRFAQRAAAEGLIVIDDPESILRCSNKVFLAEAFAARAIPAPRTLLVHRSNLDEIVSGAPIPCVVKRPDSSFSQGVSKATSRVELREHLITALENSELVLVQGFIASEFDWRVGVLGGRPLYTCRYHFPRGEWRIQTAAPDGTRRYGRVETVAADDAPKAVVDLAVRAANTVGQGLYGVDLKANDEGIFVIEVNDNPNIDAGYEDKVLGRTLYETVMRYFVDRLVAR
ncbi:MAG: RimK family protein [Sandaracinaceae bacterium]